jgi:hypothetical protein
MKLALPVSFPAQFAGKSRNSGDFSTTDGDRVEYGEKYLFLCQSGEGLAQTCEFTDKALLEVGYDTAKAVLFEPVEIRGDAVINTEGRSYLKPHSVTAKQAAKAA